MGLIKSKIVAVVGPTATGKSEFAVALARRFKGEIISADSRQVYRGLDLGTGKITKREMQGIPHYLLDVASPKTQYSVAKFQKLATKYIKQILKRGKLPIIVGGTGFWVEVLVNGQVLPDVPPNPVLRKKLKKLSIEQLFIKLKKTDPQRATKIDRYNRRRLERALEIVAALGRVKQIEPQVSYEVLWLGLNFPRPLLAERILKRLDARIRRGLIAEVRRLRVQDISWRRLDDLGLEYRFVARYLQGLLTKAQMREQLYTAIRQYAKRQETWFKRNSKIRWLNSIQKAFELTSKFLDS